MNVSRIFITTASAMSVLAAIGCTSTQRAPEVAPAPMVVEAAPPQPVAVAEVMPSHPALQNERTAEVAVTEEAPVIVAQEPAMAMPAADFTERPPQADRN